MYFESTDSNVLHLLRVPMVVFKVVILKIILEVCMKVVSVIEFMNGEGPLCECTTGSVAFCIQNDDFGVVSVLSVLSSCSIF